MPATTNNFQIPYPTGGDPVRDGPQTFAEAMQLIDDWLHEPFIIIDGQRYPLSGAVKNPGGWSYTSNNSGNFNGTIKIDPPYIPPEGYTFQLFCLESSGFTHISTCIYNRNTGKIEARVYQAGNNSAAALGLIGWRLISLSQDPNRLLGNY